MTINKNIKHAINFTFYPCEYDAILYALRGLRCNDRVYLKSASFSNMFKHNFTDTSEDAFVYFELTDEETPYITIDNIEREVTLFLCRDNLNTFINQILHLINHPGKGYSLFGNNLRIGQKYYVMLLCNMSAALAITFRRHEFREELKAEIEDMYASSPMCLDCRGADFESEVSSERNAERINTVCVCWE